ncbi:AraC family transcriptional regulator [Tritonibacter litoralis]|nr:AraC family transcriptional regulator [Tritonibacter litoralis]
MPRPLVANRRNSPPLSAYEHKLNCSNTLAHLKAGVFSGQVTDLQLQPGLGLHTLNATAQQSFVVDSHRQPGAVLHCFLEGETDARLDNLPMNLGRRPGTPVKLVLTSTDTPLEFLRRSAPNEYVRKVSIQMSPEWLDTNGLRLPRSSHTAGGVIRLERLANAIEIQNLEGLAATDNFAAPVQRLHAQATTLALVAGFFDDLPDQPVHIPQSKRTKSQLQRIEDLASQPGPMPTLSGLAAEAGLSQSGLRRLIQSVYGCAPLAHIRNIRLDMARRALERDHISVEAAATLAGYASPANFATAFRRAYGQTPSQFNRKQRIF